MFVEKHGAVCFKICVCKHFEYSVVVMINPMTKWRLGRQALVVMPFFFFLLKLERISNPENEVALSNNLYYLMILT